MSCRRDVYPRDEPMTDIAQGANPYLPRFDAIAERSLRYLIAELQADTPPSRPSLEIHNHTAHVLAQALSRPALWPDVRRALTLLAPIMEQAGHRADWTSLLESALETCRTHADTEGEAILCYHLGTLYRLQARFKDADAAFTKSACCHAELGDQIGYARVVGRHAYLAWTQRDFTTARRLAEACLVDHETTMGDEDNKIRAYAYLVIGALMFDAQQFAEAERHFSASLVLWQQTGDQRMTAIMLSNRAITLQELGRYDAAINDYQDALRIHHAIEDTTGWAITQMNLGILYRRQQSYTAALTCYRQAETVFLETNNVLLLARLYNNIGEVRRDLAQWSQAESAYRSSLTHWATVQNVAEQINTLDNLIAALLSQRRFGEAQIRLDEATALLPLIVDDPAYSRLAATLRTKQTTLQQQGD